MALHREWKKIARKAWSFRLMLVAGLFAAAEALLPYFADDVPRSLFAVLTLVAIVGGMVSRVIVQREFSDE